MSRISKNNKYAICWLHSQGKDIDYISKELKLPKEQINKFIKNNTSNNIDNQEQITNNNTNKPKTAKDFIIHHSQNNKNNVSIMTPQASMLADEARKSYPLNNNSPFYIKK